MSVFIVAEMSCNHGGDLQTAYELIDVANDAGADAVKISLDNPRGGITLPVYNKYFKMKSGPWKGEYLYDLYKRTATPWRWVPKLKKHAKRLGIELFSTVSCIQGVAFCDYHDLPRYKVSSFEACDIPLLRAIKDTGRPVIISCGADWQDGYDEMLEYEGKASFLYCVSKYPATWSDFDLWSIWKYDGISDHSLGGEVAIAAVAQGAKIVEKHLTLSRENKTADAAFSMEPEEFKSMITQIRHIETAMLPKRKKAVDRSLCKSLFAAEDIRAGERYTERNIAIVRPGYGLPPKEYYRVIGEIAKCDIKKGTPIKEGML